MIARLGRGGIWVKIHDTMLRQRGHSGQECGWCMATQTPSDLNAVAGRPNCSVKPKQGAESPAQTHAILLQPLTDVTPCRAVAQHQQSSDVTEKEVMLGVHKKWNVLLWSLFDVQNCVTDETKVLAFNGGYRGGAPCCYEDVLGLHRSSFSVSSWQLAAIGDWLGGGVLYMAPHGVGPQPGRNVTLCQQRLVHYGDHD